MQNLLVSINIITFNGERYIKKLLESIANQTYKNIEVNLLDNNSQDETLKIIEKMKKGLGFRVQGLGLKENAGFAKGHNMLIEKSRGEFILMLNQDAWLDKNYVNNALDIFAKDDRIAALQPRIYRYSFEKSEVVKKDGKSIIDTTGLVMFKNRRVIAQGQGQKDEGQFETQGEVFGADGAAPIFRRNALEDIKIPTSYKLPACAEASASRQATSFEILDENFFMYKEDVDLSWRLRLYGWNIVYCPCLIAYHERGSGDSAARNYLSIAKERRHISRLAKSLSWRNQRLMQIKNELPSLYLKHLPQIFFKEICSLVYILLFERYALQSVKEFFILAPKAWQKRKEIMAHKKARHREMAKWFQ